MTLGKVHKLYEKDNFTLNRAHCGLLKSETERNKMNCVMYWSMFTK